MSPGAVTVLGTRPVRKPRAQLGLDVGIRRPRVPPPQVGPHQLLAGLEEVKRQPEPLSRVGISGCGCDHDSNLAPHSVVTTPTPATGRPCSTAFPAAPSRGRSRPRAAPGARRPAKLGARATRSRRRARASASARHSRSACSSASGSTRTRPCGSAQRRARAQRRPHAGAQADGRREGRTQRAHRRSGFPGRRTRAGRVLRAARSPS